MTISASIVSLISDSSTGSGAISKAYWPSSYEVTSDGSFANAEEADPIAPAAAIPVAPVTNPRRDSSMMSPFIFASDARPLPASVRVLFNHRAVHLAQGVPTSPDGVSISVMQTMRATIICHARWGSCLFACAGVAGSLHKLSWLGRKGIPWNCVNLPISKRLRRR